MEKKETDNELYVKYIKEFQKFHNDFYSELRKFLIDNLDAQEERRNEYMRILETNIKHFCTKNISEFLHTGHSLKKEFLKEKDSTEKIPFRGIVFLHSREFGEGKKIAIPFGVWESEEESDLPPKKWTQRRVGVSINTGS